MKRKAVILIAGLWLFGAFSAPMKAQVLKDTSTFRLVCRGVDYIYNLQFSQARDVYQRVVAVYPEHPMNYIYKGLLTYWENYPLLSSSPFRESFEKDMRYAIELCEKKAHPDDEAEFLLCNIGARGMLLEFYADNGMSMNVFSLASSTYQYLRRTFDFTNDYADFFFFTGLYKYYREAYTDAHPVYKPLALLFPKGNIDEGRFELQIASKKAIVLKAEAYSFLTGISINYENDFQQAYLYSKSLHELYPNNLQYMGVYITNLLLMKRYDKAESLIRSSEATVSNKYYQAQLSIFNGILYEKKYRDINQAQSFYKKGITEISRYGDFGNEFISYAYFGLSRISQSDNDKRNTKMYRKRAMELSNYKNVNFDN